jgi:glutathione S-transferase
MSYILYGHPRSGSCIVELGLAEIGAPHETRDINLNTDQQREAEYAARNPQRKLPTLVTPKGETLTESAAILLTLDRRHPEAKLLPPQGSAAYAQALRWLMFIASEIYPLVEINDYPERFAPQTIEDTGPVREIARQFWRQRWLIVEDHIAGNPYLLGSDFCLSDIYIAVVSRWAQQNEWRPAHIPKVERLTAAVAARPACTPVWTRHFS